MKFEPRDYQIEAMNKLKRYIAAGNKRIVLQASTGVGKTYLAAWIVEGALTKSNRVAFVAPYTVLINQTVERFVEQEVSPYKIGVMQGNHEMTNPSCPVQICTAQTLGRRQRPKVEIVIVDECHLMYKTILEWMESEPNTIFIGLSATPWSPGMGKYWQDLIKIKSLQQNLDDKTLSPYKLYSFGNPDVSGVGTQNGDYKQGEIAAIMEDYKIIGNIREQWLKHAGDRQTIAFCVNVKHANKVCNDLGGAGVKADVITAKTPIEERELMFKRFSDRQLQVLVSVGCLIAGFDSYVDCIIWAVRTKSPIKFIQGVGRGLRNAPGKDYCLVMDFSGTFLYELGYPEAIDAEFTELDDGKERESSQAKRRVKPNICPECGVDKDSDVYDTPKGVHECPECGHIPPNKCPAKDCGHEKGPGVRECQKCGFIPRDGQDVETMEDMELNEIGKKMQPTKEEKQQFWSELKGWQAMRNEKVSATGKGKRVVDGALAHRYKEKFGVWPRSLHDRPLDPSPQTLSWIKSRQIAYAKKLERERKTA